MARIDLSRRQSFVSTSDLINIFERLRMFMDKSAGNAPTDDFYNFCRAFEGHLEDIVRNLRTTVYEEEHLNP